MFKSSIKKYARFILQNVFLRFGYIQTALAVLFFQIFFVVGIGKCSALAPDERLYLQTFMNLYFARENQSFYVGGTSNWVYELFFLPALFLVHLGLEPIYAIRGSAIVHSQLFLALTWTYVSKIPRTIKPPFIAIPFLLSFGFFFFSSLGLRESIVFLCLIAFFRCLKLLNQYKNFASGLPLLIVLFFFANLKSYLYVLLIVSAVFTIIFIRNQGRLRIVLGSVVLLSFMSVYISPTSELKRVQDSMSKGDLKIKLGDFRSFSFNFDALFSMEENFASVTRAEISKCNKENSIGFLKFLLAGFGNPESLPGVSSEKVDTDYPATNLYSSTKPRELVYLGHLPFNLINFTFGPLPGAGGGLSFIGLFDSIVWMFFYLFVLFVLMGKTRFRFVLDTVGILALSFFISFVIFSSAFEINSGTSFRHRMLLSIPMMVIFSQLRIRTAVSIPPISVDDQPKAGGKEHQ